MSLNNLFLIFSLFLAPQIGAQPVKKILEIEKDISEGRTELSFHHDLAPHALFPYLEAAQIKRNPYAQPSEIVKFLKKHPYAPFSIEIANSVYPLWANSGKNQEIVNSYSPAFKSNPALFCHYQVASSRTSKKQVNLNEAIELYLTTKNLPSSCEIYFSNLRMQGKINKDLVKRRFFFLMQENELSQANIFLNSLPPEMQTAANTWLLARKNGDFVEAQSIMDREWRAAALDDIFNRYAKNRLDECTDVALAEAQKGTFKDLSPDLKIGSGLSRLVGRLAQNDDFRAEAIFKLIPQGGFDKNPTLDLVALELRMRRYQVLADLLNRLDNKTIKNTPEYLYWKAKAYEKLNQTANADKFYKEIAKERDYFGFLAAAKKGLPLAMNDERVERNQNAQNLAQNAGIYRYLSFIRMGEYKRAEQEFKALTAGASKEETRQVAKIALQAGQHMTVINALAKTKDWNALTLRFPVLYTNQIKMRANQNGIAPETVMAIIRKESTFRPAIKSSAGAIGLMQVMPATAKHTASKNGIAYGGVSDLTDPNKNIEIGTKYLADRIYEFGHLAYAAAGYNAGPSRVVAWQEKYPNAPLDEWIAQIPFYETRDYVKRVLEYEVIYQYLLGKKPEIKKNMRLW